MHRIAAKTLVSFSFITYAVGSIAVYFATDIYLAIALSGFIGVLYTTLMTLPYKMLADFHKLDRQTDKRGLGMMVRWKTNLDNTLKLSRF